MRAQDSIKLQQRTACGRVNETESPMHASMKTHPITCAHDVPRFQMNAHSLEEYQEDLLFLLHSSSESPHCTIHFSFISSFHPNIFIGSHDCSPHCFYDEHAHSCARNRIGPPIREATRARRRQSDARNEAELTCLGMHITSLDSTLSSKLNRMHGRRGALVLLAPSIAVSPHHLPSQITHLVCSLLLINTSESSDCWVVCW
jgi:hypothetical protein